MIRISSLTLFIMLAAVILIKPCYGAEDVPEPVIELKNDTYHFGQVKEGEIVTHDFKLFNRGETVLEIKKVKPG